MTPEALTALALCLLELRNWLDETDPGSLDAAVVDRAVDVCREARQRLVTEGAR